MHPACPIGRHTISLVALLSQIASARFIIAKLFIEIFCYNNNNNNNVGSQCLTAVSNNLTNNLAPTKQVSSPETSRAPDKNTVPSWYMLCARSVIGPSVVSQQSVKNRPILPEGAPTTRDKALLRCGRMVIFQQALELLRAQVKFQIQRLTDLLCWNNNNERGLIKISNMPFNVIIRQPTQLARGGS